MCPAPAPRYEKGKVLVFVHSQEKCDQIFRDLLRSGYPCLSLHGGKDQLDRESTVSDFKGDPPAHLECSAPL